MIKYVKIATFYKQAIDYYYSKYPDITKEDYSVQYRHFMDQYYGMSDSYERELSDLGIDAIVIPVNVEPLLLSWGNEHGLNDFNKEEIVISQLKQINPIILFIDDISCFPIEYLAKIRKEIKSVRLFIGNCCSPYNDYTLQVYKTFNFVFCCCNQLAKELNEQGIKTYVVMHGFDPKILQTLNSDIKKDIDILFTGSIIPGKGFHKQRNDLINKIIEKGINLSIYGNIRSQKKIVVRIKQLIYLIYKFLKSIDVLNIFRSEILNRKILSGGYPQYIPFSKDLLKHVHEPRFGLDMFKLIQRSRICLNIHGDIASVDAANMRLFEATGMGTCLLTDWKANMCTLFDEGVEAVTYKDADDCVDKIHWLLSHPDRIEKISLAGQRKCLEKHSVRERAREMYDILMKELGEDIL